MRADRRFQPESRLFVVALLLGFLGCSKSADDRVDSAVVTAVDTTSKPSASEVATASDPGHRGRPGDDQSTEDYIERIKFAKNSAEGDIFKGRVECHAGSVHTSPTLTIRPVTHGHKIKWSSALGGGPGHFFARVEVADADCEDLGLRRGEAGLLWIGATEGKARTVQIFRVKGKRVHSGAIKTATVVAYCNTTPPQKPAAHIVPPSHCTDDEPNDSGKNTVVYQDPVKHLGVTQGKELVIHNQGLWVSCGSGCCQSQFTN